jgi:hypothetical protein
MVSGHDLVCRLWNRFNSFSSLLLLLYIAVDLPNGANLVKPKRKTRLPPKLPPKRQPPKDDNAPVGQTKKKRKKAPTPVLDTAEFVLNLQDSAQDSEGWCCRIG